MTRRTLFLLLLGLLGLLLAPPAPAQEPLTRIAFGSCADQERPQPVWRGVLGYRPELFLFAGDNVYGDQRDGRPLPDTQLMQGLRDAYAAALKQPGFMRIKSEVRHLATWDDHDYGKDDAGAEFAHKRESQRLFLEFWRVPADDPRHGRDGVYQAQAFGPAGQRVQVILLDTRFFRSPWRPTDRAGAPGKEKYLPDADPAKTMLGEAQWAWLAERLREPAELRLIVSSIQVLADGHGWERWGNFPHQRRRLFDLIRETNANGVIFLSGDRHLGALYRETGGVPYPLVEITSSGLNRSFPNNREPGPNRLGAVYGAPNFGTVDIDWWEGRVTLSVRGVNGEPARRHTVMLDELRPQ
jgi:alkaline phosphatase D